MECQMQASKHRGNIYNTHNVRGQESYFSLAIDLDASRNGTRVDGTSKSYKMVHNELWLRL